MATGAYFVAYDFELWVALGTTASATPTSTAGLTRIFSLSDASVKGTSQKTGAIDYETGIGGRKDLVTEVGYNLPCTMNVSVSDAGYKLLKQAWKEGAQGTTLQWYRITPVKDGSGQSSEVHAGVAFVEGFDENVRAGEIATVSFTLAGFGNLVWVPQGGVGATGVATVTITSGGAGLTTGTYTGVDLVGGTGGGAKATLVVSAGAVTTATITSGGTGYTVGDVLTAPSFGGVGAGDTLPTFAVATLA
jgi:hypothetical protein